MSYARPMSKSCTRATVSTNCSLRQNIHVAPSLLGRGAVTLGATTARSLATVVDTPAKDHSPLDEYDRRVIAGILRNDEHQRGEQAAKCVL